MKKTIASIIIAAVTVGSAFSQGYINFSDSSTTAVFDNFTANGTASKNANVMVGILFSTTPSSTLGVLGSTASGAAATTPNIWSQLLSASGWQWAVNSANSAVLTAQTRANVPVNGTFSAGVVGLAGTAANDIATFYVIGWNAAYATPAEAAAAGSAIGWSNPFNETLGSSSAPGSSMNGAGMKAFTVNPLAPVPEPTTMALAALGGASLLLFRRRK